MIMGEWKTKRSAKTKKLSPFYLERIIIQLLYDGVFNEKFKAGNLLHCSILFVCSFDMFYVVWYRSFLHAIKVLSSFLY